MAHRIRSEDDREAVSANVSVIATVHCCVVVDERDRLRVRLQGIFIPAEAHHPTLHLAICSAKKNSRLQPKRGSHCP
jgi:hypothetical protein